MREWLIRRLGGFTMKDMNAWLRVMIKDNARKRMLFKEKLRTLKSSKPIPLPTFVLHEKSRWTSPLV